MPNNHISIAAYTRSEDKHKRLHVKVYDTGLPGAPKRMEIRVGEVCFYLDVNDAQTMANEMLAEIRTGVGA